MFNFGREICGHLSLAEKREWLVTNGIGGFASGTVAGTLTRRYHGLLIAALKPPLGRTLLLTKFDETLLSSGQMYALFTNRWASGVVDPSGHRNLERFRLEGTTPVWTFACADALLEKRVWMQPGANTTYVQYNFCRGSRALVLTLKSIVNYRDYHNLTRANSWQMQVFPVEHGLKITAFDGATPFYILSNQAEAIARHSWYRNYHLNVEAYRGLADTEDHLNVGTFRVILTPGESFSMVASTEAAPNLNSHAALAKRQAHEQKLVKLSPIKTDTPRGWELHLPLAADQFITRRPHPVIPDGHTVIAGYPWFGDWGRDTMIALPGLTLNTGRPEIARSILQTFAQFVDQGMLPNRFPDAGEVPEYNTVDAALWYFYAIYHYLRQTNDTDFAGNIYPTLQAIVDWHYRGTRYNIHVDPHDNLLYAGQEGVQLTWMDAKVGDWVVTPRLGKPVEVNALWYNALRIMAYISQLVNHPDQAEHYNCRADVVADNFQQRFWYDAGSYLYDVIDAPADAPCDQSLRPNQIFAVSLPFKLLNNAQAKSVVDICTRNLLTSHGLRTLSPDDPSYKGNYGGGPLQRDGAYHQGTAWAWLLGHFVSAHLKVYRNPELARSFLHPLIQQLTDGCVGSVSEIFDGEPPFLARGCFAQAWSVAELLRAWQETYQKSQ